MPLFDYKCTECDKVIEKRVNKHDEEVLCPCEKSVPMVKMVCSPAIVGMDNLGRSGGQDD